MNAVLPRNQKSGPREKGVLQVSVPVLPRISNHTDFDPLPDAQVFDYHALRNDDIDTDRMRVFRSSQNARTPDTQTRWAIATETKHCGKLSPLWN